MPETWTVIAVIMSISCALIMGVPAVRRWRDWRRRRDLLRRFTHGLTEGQLRVKHRREKIKYGNFFSDSYAGTSGAMPFRIRARIEPFKAFHAVWFDIFVGNDAHGEPSYERWHHEWRRGAPAGDVARVYEAVLSACWKDESLIEAS